MNTKTIEDLVQDLKNFVSGNHEIFLMKLREVSVNLNSNSGFTDITHTHKLNKIISTARTTLLDVNRQPTQAYKELLGNEEVSLQLDTFRITEDGNRAHRLCYKNVCVLF